MLQVHRFGRIEIRPDERLLLIGGKPVELGARAFDLLIVLIAHHDRVMTKDELLDLVWPGVVVEENNLQVQVFALRKALGSRAIATIPGRGYQFVVGESGGETPTLSRTASRVPLAAAPGMAISADALIRATRPIAHQVATLLAGLRQRIGRFAIMASTGIVFAGIFGYWYALSVTNAEINSRPPIAAASYDREFAIAVLPFTNLTGDPTKEYVADSLTANLTADVSRLGFSHIVEAGTAATYKGKAVTAQQVGRELGVRYVLQGNVQSSGAMIRINTQLADAANNAHLWSENFDADPSVPIARQDKDILRIGNSIIAALIFVKSREIETRQSRPSAAELVIRATALDVKPVSLKNYQAQEALFREALALEATNGFFMARLAQCLIFQATNFGDTLDMHIKEAKFSEARDLALKARVLNPDNRMVYLSLAIYARTHDDFDGARRAYKTHLSRNPRSAYAHMHLAVSYFYGGEPERAIELLNHAMDLLAKQDKPTVISLNMCRVHLMMGDNDRAIHWCQKSLEVNPTFSYSLFYLALAYSLKGEDVNARAAIAELRRNSPRFDLSDGEMPPMSSYPAAYKEWYAKKLTPAVGKLALLE